MSEPTGALRDISLLLADSFRVHPERSRGNGAGRPVEPGIPPCLPSILPDITPEAVREELEYILQSPEFKDRPMLRGFLTFVVEETLAGRAHQIKGYTVATQVFGRRSDFDPTVDPIVRIQAGRLRRALEIYYSGLSSQRQLRIGIGKGSYIPTFSKAFPEKLRLVQSQFHSGAGHPRASLSREAAAAIPFSHRVAASVAIMPLVNLSNDPDAGHMADGLAEELMIELARCPALQVNTCCPAMQQKEMWSRAGETGSKPGVEFCLLGSLRKEGQTVKFTFRLINTATEMQIWGEQYKRVLGSNTEIEIQEEIAQSIAGTIGALIEGEY